VRRQAAVPIPQLAAGSGLTVWYTRRLIRGQQEVMALAGALGVEPGELLKPVEGRMRLSITR